MGGSYIWRSNSGYSASACATILQPNSPMRLSSPLRSMVFSQLAIASAVSSPIFLTWSSCCLVARRISGASPKCSSNCRRRMGPTCSIRFNATNASCGSTRPWITRSTDARKHKVQGSERQGAKGRQFSLWPLRSAPGSLGTYGFLTPPYGLPYGLELKNNPRLCTSLRVYASNTPQEAAILIYAAARRQSENCRAPKARMTIAVVWCAHFPVACGGERGHYAVMAEIQKNVLKFLTEYGFQIIGAIIILLAGLLTARWIGRMTEQWLTKKAVE